MLLKVTILPIATGKLTNAEKQGFTYTEKVFDEEAGLVRWNNIIQLGLFIKEEHKLIPPHRIAEARIVEEGGNDEIDKA